ncbi:MAG: hypothetical protein EXQ96_07185 [Alphaproteobacteria bacterium]|nr:hypothetical protein [Alphaproteobacteria bacterium]
MTNSADSAAFAAVALSALPALLNGDPAHVRRGSHFTGGILVGVGAADAVLRIESGRIVAIERGATAFDFGVRGSLEAWSAFWQPVPAPGHHDLMAILKAGTMTLEGDRRRLMAYLQWLKDIMAAPRRLPRS